MILFLPNFTINLTNLIFEIVNFPFLDGDVPRSASYGVIFLNSSDLLEHLAMLQTLTLAINS